ncbi:glycosyltransferase [Marinivivus vitaminiproducens]|uniref:glycosyltransferase n=1 Tax=Marinivivus vitaminiproducens TaxID=3035935 RepID=UPI0027A0A914|nr:glycosyltransferase family A protein [Geminicoccaceae bacterium SCSIO 64248]
MTIIIPVGYDAAGLRVTLDSLKPVMEEDGRTELLVANDGGDPGVSEVCRAFGARELPIVPNAGSYGARNRALVESKGALVGFIDADQTVDAGWIAAMRRGLAEADYVAGLTRIDVEAARTMGERFDTVTAFPTSRYFDRYHFGPTANLAVRRSIIETAGGFDERVRSGGDLEFGDRVHRAGGRQLFLPAAVTIHPPRGLAEQWRKLTRIVQGQMNLAELYPDRFGHLAQTRRAGFRMLLPPTGVGGGLTDQFRYGVIDGIAFYAIAYLRKLHVFRVVSEYGRKSNRVNA